MENYRNIYNTVTDHGGRRNRRGKRNRRWRGNGKRWTEDGDWTEQNAGHYGTSNEAAEHGESWAQRNETMEYGAEIGGGWTFLAGRWNTIDNGGRTGCNGMWNAADNGRRGAGNNGTSAERGGRGTEWTERDGRWNTADNGRRGAGNHGAWIHHNEMTEHRGTETGNRRNFPQRNETAEHVGRGAEWTERDGRWNTSDNGGRWAGWNATEHGRRAERTERDGRWNESTGYGGGGSRNFGNRSQWNDSTEYDRRETGNWADRDAGPYTTPEPNRRGTRTGNNRRWTNNDGRERSETAQNGGTWAEWDGRGAENIGRRWADHGGRWNETTGSNRGGPERSMGSYEMTHHNEEGPGNGRWTDRGRGRDGTAVHDGRSRDVIEPNRRDTRNGRWNGAAVHDRRSHETIEPNRRDTRNDRRWTNTGGSWNETTLSNRGWPQHDIRSHETIQRSGQGPRNGRWSDRDGGSNETVVHDRRSFSSEALEPIRRDTRNQRRRRNRNARRNEAAGNRTWPTHDMRLYETIESDGGGWHRMAELDGRMDGTTNNHRRWAGSNARRGPEMEIPLTWTGRDIIFHDIEHDGRTGNGERLADRNGRRDEAVDHEWDEALELFGGWDVTELLGGRDISAERNRRQREHDGEIYFHDMYNMALGDYLYDVAASDSIEDRMWILEDVVNTLMNDIAEDDMIENRPSGENIIKHLPTFKISSEQEKPDCSICLVETEVGEEMMPLLCNHIFHKFCISQWLKTGSTCPICRYDQNKGLREALSLAPC